MTTYQRTIVIKVSNLEKIIDELEWNCDIEEAIDHLKQWSNEELMDWRYYAQYQIKDEKILDK